MFCFGTRTSAVASTPHYQQHCWQLHFCPKHGCSDSSRVPDSSALLQPLVLDFLWFQLLCSVLFVAVLVFSATMLPAAVTAMCVAPRLELLPCCPTVLHCTTLLSCTCPAPALLAFCCFESAWLPPDCSDDGGLLQPLPCLSLFTVCLAIAARVCTEKCCFARVPLQSRRCIASCHTSGRHLCILCHYLHLTVPLHLLLLRAFALWPCRPFVLVYRG